MPSGRLFWVVQTVALSGLSPFISAPHLHRSYDGIDSIRHLTNFGRSVLGCIEAYDSETRRIFQHFSKSTRCAFLCTTRNSIFCKKNRLFFLQMLLFIAIKPDFMTNFLTNFDEILTKFDEILTNGDEF